jgi:hypothetical protein
MSGRAEEALSLYRDLSSSVREATTDATRSLNLLKLSKFPVSAVGWLCVAGALSTWVTERGSTRRVRPWLLCVLRCSPDQEAGGAGDADADAAHATGARGMVAHRKLMAPPTADDVMMVCYDAMASSSSRPRTIIFQDNDFVAHTWNVVDGAVDTSSSTVLKAPQRSTVPPTQRISHVLRGLGVAVRHEADVMDTPAFMRFVCDKEFPHAASQLLPPIASIDGITPRDMQAFFEAAATYYRAAPWIVFSSSDVLKVTVRRTAAPAAAGDVAAAGGGDCAVVAAVGGEGADSDTVYGVVMGQVGMTYGLSVYKVCRRCCPPAHPHTSHPLLQSVSSHPSSHPHVILHYCPRRLHHTTDSVASIATASSPHPDFFY